MYVLGRIIKIWPNDYDHMAKYGRKRKEKKNTCIVHTYISYIIFSTIKAAVRAWQLGMFRGILVWNLN